MRDYGLVARSIDNLANRVGSMTDRKNRHEENMGNLDLAGAKMDHEVASRRGQQELAIKQREHDIYLDEPVTLGAFIETSDMPDEQKLEILESMPQDVASVPTTRRKALDAFETLRKEGVSKQNLKETRDFQEGQTDKKITAQDSRSEKDRASREKIAGMRVRGANKGPSVASQKYESELAMKNLMGRYGVTQGLSGGLESQPMTKEQAEAMRAEAASTGLNVYFDEGTIEDTGSGWNPFDNKDVPAYTVRAVVPSNGAPSSAPMTTAESVEPNTGSQTKQILDQLLQQAGGTPPRQTQTKPLPAQAEEESAQEAPEPIGNLPSGTQYGRSKTMGYVVIENGAVRKPTPEEESEIKQQAMGVGAYNKKITMPEYVGPKGGYYNPANYTTGR